MKILGLGWPELVLILLAALVLFGHKNLPKLTEAIGKSIKNLRRGFQDDEKDKSINEDKENNNKNASKENNNEQKADGVIIEDETKKSESKSKKE